MEMNFFSASRWPVLICDSSSPRSLSHPYLRRETNSGFSRKAYTEVVSPNHPLKQSASHLHCMDIVRTKSLR